MPQKMRRQGHVRDDGAVDMIGRKAGKLSKAQDQQSPQGFDDFHVSLGDLMRGERATLGKSLLDVQRELRIKASYIAAVENCDPSAFDTPGFIAGYVRSYARYLGMDPDDAFRQFCTESGFTTAHGMSDQASSIRKEEERAPRPKARDPLADPKLPFAPQSSSPFANVEPGAIGSTLVLLALIAGIGYGGWTVLKEVQRVQLAPVDQTPVVLSELDPLEEAMSPSVMAERQEQSGARGGSGVYSPPTAEAFDRLYRPQALDVPVVVARDAPISTLDPESVGVFAGVTRSDLPRIRQDSRLAAAALDDFRRSGDGAPRTGLPQQGVTLVAARPSWVRLRDGEGNVLHSGILDAGDTVPVPADATDPRVELGEAGAIYFAVNGDTLGPAGDKGQSSEDVPLDPALLAAIYPRADLESDGDLRRVIAELSQPRQPDPRQQFADAGQGGDDQRPSPQVLAESAPGVTIVATRDSWVRVKSSSGATVYEAIMNAGDTYSVPRTEQAPTIRTGNAGAIYFSVGGQTYGPYGSNGAIADNLSLDPERVVAQFAQADVSGNEVLARTVAELEAGTTTTFD